MKLLLVSLYWPPAGGGGVQRPLKFAQYLPALGIETHVLAPDDSADRTYADQPHHLDVATLRQHEVARR